MITLDVQAAVQAVFVALLVSAILGIWKLVVMVVRLEEWRANHEELHGDKPKKGGNHVR